MVAIVADGLVYRARDVKESADKVSEADLLDVVGRPWNPTSLAQQERDLHYVPRAHAERDLADDVQEAVPISAYIRRAILRRCWYSPGCLKCR